MDICQKRRGIYIDMQFLDENRVTLIYEMPLNEIIYDFLIILSLKLKVMLLLIMSLRNIEGLIW